MWLRWFPCSLLGLVASVAGVARAQPAPAAQTYAPPAEVQATAFTALSFDAGFMYLRPRMVLGYGHPHHSWLGVEADPTVSRRFAAGYGGLRLNLPSVDLRAGVRRVRAHREHFLLPRRSYDRDALALQQSERARYWMYDAELSFGQQLWGGVALAEVGGAWLQGLPRGQLVFEQRARVVMKGRWLLRGRAGWGPLLGRRKTAFVAVVAEVLRVPGRDTTTLRAGVIVRAQLWPSLEVRANFVPPALSPDQLGIRGGDFAQLGVRYRWQHRFTEPEARP